MNAIKYCSFCDNKVNIRYKDLERVGWRVLRESGGGITTTHVLACPSHSAEFQEIVKLYEQWRRVRCLELISWADFLKGAGWERWEYELEDWAGRIWASWPKFKTRVGNWAKY